MINPPNEASVMLRRLYRAMLRWYCRKTFTLWQRLGLHVTRCHFYEPIPDTRELDNSIWENRSGLVGIDVDEGTQLDLLSHFKTAFKDEYDQFPREKTGVPYDYYVHNDMFEAVDAEILYCMIRHFKPRRLIEIGSGYSTLVVAKALLNNQKDHNSHPCECIVIDPFPNRIVRKGIAGVSRLVPEPVQKVPLAEFEKLRETDMLLIDSSHVLKIGSDVEYEYLEILPRLNEGVLVSFHDIFLPAEYRKTWVMKDHCFWNEQYLLQAFLAFNTSFRILWAGSYMHLKHSEELRDAFPSYDQVRDWPGSFWIRRV